MMILVNVTFFGYTNFGHTSFEVTLSYVQPHFGGLLDKNVEGVDMDR
jgi:hypothetical protein